MPYEGLHASFSGDIPHLLCFAVAAVHVVNNSIQALRALTPVAGDTMGTRISAGCQRRPAWWRDRRDRTEQVQVFTAGTAINEFLDVWHLAFVHEMFGDAGVHPVNTEDHQFLGHCLSSH